MRSDERLSIAQLSLRLPAGFAQRAPRIARLTAHALAAQPIGGSARLGNLHVPPLHVNPRRSDRAIAHQLATAIAGHISKTTTTVQG